MADYMMSFGLEKIVESAPGLIGPKTKAWVERVHERWALQYIIPEHHHPDIHSHRPAYKRVSAHIDGELPRAKL
jgi:hypothetical protein